MFRSAEPIRLGGSDLVEERPRTGKPSPTGIEILLRGANTVRASQQD